MHALRGAGYRPDLAYPWEFNPWEWMRRRACCQKNKYRRFAKEYVRRRGPW